MSQDGFTRELVIERVRQGLSLENEKLKGIDLSRANLRGAKMAGAQFRYSDLTGADLRGADLRRANLRHVNLRSANLEGADLREADLTHADIRGAIFTRAKLVGAKFGNTRGLSTKVFFPQALIDRILVKAHGDLVGDELKIPQKGEHWKLIPAARIVALEAGSDTRGLLHRIVFESQYQDYGLEVYKDTALVADTDTVYRLDVGFVGEPLHPIRPHEEAPADTASRATATAPKFDDPKKSDQELINEFLLKRLTSS